MMNDGIVNLSASELEVIREMAQKKEQERLRTRLVNGELGIDKTIVGELVSTGVLDEKIKKFGLTEQNAGLVVSEAAEAYKMKIRLEELEKSKTTVVAPPSDNSLNYQQPQTSQQTTDDVFNASIEEHWNKSSLPEATKNALKAFI